MFRRELLEGKVLGEEAHQYGASERKILGVHIENPELVGECWELVPVDDEDGLVIGVLLEEDLDGVHVCFVMERPSSDAGCLDFGDKVAVVKVSSG